MGSSHSAPRRQSSRRNLRTYPTSADPPDSPSEHSHHSSEELPALLEESRRRRTREQQQQPQSRRSVAVPTRVARWERAMGELSVIESNRSLRPEEMNPTTSDTAYLQNDEDEEEPGDGNNNRYGTPQRIPPARQYEEDDESEYPSQPHYRPPPQTVVLQGGDLDYHDHDEEHHHQKQHQHPIYYPPDLEYDEDDDDDQEVRLTPHTTNPDFFPQASRNYEWMSRSLETLILGSHQNIPPILCLPEAEDDRWDETSFWGATRRRSTASTLGSDFGRRSSLGSFASSSRRGSLVGSSIMHGGTLANYYNNRARRGGASGSVADRRDSTASTNMNRRGSTSAGPAANFNRRGSTSHGPSYRRRFSTSQSTSSSNEDAPLRGGPNVVLSLLARETTGRRTSRNIQTATSQLQSLGGHDLFNSLDRPAGGMCSEVAFLSEVIDSGDWAETQTVISRISPRLIGDPTALMHHGPPGSERPAVPDPNLPPTASSYYAGGGRVGLERDAFVLAGGVEVLIRIFREPSFVGAEMAQTYDARDLSEELVANRLAPCWNEALACLRELIYHIPTMVENEILDDGGDFLPFLFTLLSHDSCFDGAAVLVEEILSLQSHSPPQPPTNAGDNFSEGGAGYQASVRASLPKTFFLGNIPDLYKLWSGFNCRQLAHFCRILALLVFEPEDRQLLESPAVLKSIELLQLRRNRAARAGRDSTVDMNQAILLGDEQLTIRLLKLLRVMNFAPALRRSNSYHVMSHFPFIADTLVMLGLSELDAWDEVDRLEALARKLLEKGVNEEVAALCELGSVADMLENLSSALMGGQGEAPTNQLGHIIHVISAAQQAGVVVGRPRQNRARRRGHHSSQHRESRASENGGVPSENRSRLGGNHSVQEDGDENPSNLPSVQVLGLGLEGGQGFRDSLNGYPAGRRPRVNTPDDAANALQFNALLLGPYQVEVLFVLCTLLGGRRKIDAQELLNECGIVSILDDMFQRLPWDSLSPTREPISNRGSHTENNALREGQPGIHGPGCDCTPESALCVQYLRLLHNFCDRDCDNYAGRRLLLSDAERRFVFDPARARDPESYNVASLRPGLLSKIVAAFIGESDESPYRFWLASCVESYLRGSSPAEQMFVAQNGLLKHLIGDITSERLHCAGSLQTSFDLLGELCKGNAEALRLLVADLDEESFRKLMSVAAANLVDSNVFIRALLLSLERISSSDRLIPLHLDPELFEGRTGKWRSNGGLFSRSYLTHSWWDSCLINVTNDNESSSGKGNASESRPSPQEVASDVARPSDWFPTMGAVEAHNMKPPTAVDGSNSPGLHDGVGHFGWVFTPSGDSLSSAVHAPNTLERLSWFLAANQTRLLRDLLGVVDLRNINHENICCLNTAVVIAIFAYRRQQLPDLLKDLRRMNDEERANQRRALGEAIAIREDDVIDRAFVQAMKYFDADSTPVPPYARRASLNRRSSFSQRAAAENQAATIGDRNDVLRNFREVLWFWVEYYTHRGRDRLSLEFSSHLRFQEWIDVVSLLAADTGEDTSLVPSAVRLPRSPYQSAARIAEHNPLLRGL